MRFLPILPILTRYPFLRLAAEFFKGEFKSLDEALNSNLFPEAVEIARNVVFASLDGKVFERDYESGDLLCLSCDEKCLRRFDDYDKCVKYFENCKIDFPRSIYEELRLKAKLAILAYISSKVIVSLSDDWVRMRFAVSEANYYAELLRKEKDYVVKLIAGDLGIRLKGWRIHVTSYVKASSRIKAENWRLVNRRFSSGYVYTNKREVLRVVEEFLRERLAEKIKAEELKDYFAEILKDLKLKKRKKRFEKIDIGIVDFDKFPPCIKEIIAEVQSGMNVPHIARFTLASFLLNIGMRVDEVVEVFKSAPDFDEDKTRYQVEHIAGQRGRCVEYICPSCDTMRSYQLCVSNCDVKHPIEYYRKGFKAKRSRKMK